MGMDSHVHRVNLIPSQQCTTCMILKCSWVEWRFRSLEM